MLAIITSLLKLGGLILTEIFEAKKRARLKLEKFELTQHVFNEMVERSLLKLKKQVSQNNSDLDDLDDQMSK